MMFEFFALRPTEVAQATVAITTVKGGQVTEADNDNEGVRKSWLVSVDHVRSCDVRLFCAKANRGGSGDRSPI
jgi:hypothetical protein